MRDFAVIETEAMQRLQTVAIVDDRLTNLKILERLASTLDGVQVRTYDRAQKALDDAQAAPRPVFTSHARLSAWELPNR